MTGAPAPAGPWGGVLVAMTTPFTERLEVDLDAFVAHGRWLLEHGVDGLVVGGSLGEGASLSPEERAAMLRAAAPFTSGGRALVAAVGATTTDGAVGIARDAERAGAHGLLVLPPYVYRGDRRETHAHFVEVLRATRLPAMLYNNPAAYGTDLLPEAVLDLAAECPQLRAVKESSGDVRRITALRSLLGGRLALSVGLDDAVVEGVAAGATGWVAGLANALPDESVALFARARAGEWAVVEPLYQWFLPLLRMDAAPKFVQLVKLVEAEVGRGTPRVRPPRRPLEDDERARALEVVREALRRRPVGFDAPGPGRG
ncbi:MAG TPA: dihydrodipicolinate synthase family protein [Thermoplasmata archaeon]|nr:dihydrodipicolinate synthase family protein [Thermoplasmata archaeon]